MADNEEYSDGVAEGEDFSDDGEDFSGDEASSDNGADDADEFEYQGKGGGLAFDVGVGSMPVLVLINGVNQEIPLRCSNLRRIHVMVFCFVYHPLPWSLW